jgi:hypothetical protein
MKFSYSVSNPSKEWSGREDTLLTPSFRTSIRQGGSKMEIVTRVRDFSEKIKYHRIPPDTYVRVIIDRSEKNSGNERMLPIISHEEQKRILNLIPKEYEPGASEELTKIISEARMNTEPPEL